MRYQSYIFHINPGNKHDYHAPVDQSKYEVGAGVVGDKSNRNDFGSPSQSLQRSDDDELMNVQITLLRTQREIRRSQQRANQLAAELAATKSELAAVRSELDKVRK